MRMLSFFIYVVKFEVNFFFGILNLNIVQYALHLYLAKKEDFCWGFTFEDISLIRVD